MVIIEYLLFKSYAYREVMFKIPRNADQLSYITTAYSIYENIVIRNWSVVFKIINTEVLTGGLVFIGVINLFLFGESYYSFLLINFFAYILAQIIGSLTIYSISKNKCHFIMFFGLFFMLKSPFYWAGDILDFRQDFIAFCLYTVWLSLLILYNFKSNKKYKYLSAVAAGLLIFCRMLSCIYIVINIFIIEFIYVFVTKQYGIKDGFLNIIKYGFIVILSGGWFLLIKIPSFLSYYINLHMMNAEPEIRAAEQNVYTLMDNILFYPKSLLNDHVGIMLICILCLIVIYQFFILKKKISTEQKLGLLICIVSIIVPIFILTIDLSKSSVVINIISGAVVLLAALLWSIINSDKNGYKVFSIIFLIGFSFFIKNISFKHQGYAVQEQKQLIKINDMIAEYIIDNENDEPRILVDHLFDAIKDSSVEYWLNEKYRKKISVLDAIDVMNPSSDGIVEVSEVAKIFTDEEIMEALNKADIIVVSKDGYNDSFYITDQEFDRYRDKIWDYANTHFDLIGHVKVDGCKISVFGR